MYARSMNQYIVLKIAETRFAIKSDYDVFTKWLTEACADFLSPGKPHAWLNLSFDTTTKSQLPSDTAFSFIPRYDGDETNFKVTCGDTDKPDNMFRSMLHVCLHHSVISKQPPDLWMHSSGVVYREGAYIFTGRSGAGKSTICNILAKEPGFTILHDETVAFSQNGEGFRAWSSPLRGERPARHCLSAPLQAIFFLSHAETNHAVRLSGRDIPGLLSNSLIRLAAAVDGNLARISRDTINVILTLAECIPCYELHFKPDFSFWEYIERLFFE